MLRPLFALLFTFLGMYISMAQDYSTFLIPQNLKQNANAVVRLNKVSYEISDIDRMNVRNQWAITVFNEDGLGYLRPNAYYNNSSRVRDVEVVIYDRNGKEIDKFKKKDFRDVSAVDGATLYSDSRVLSLDYTPVSYPFTMEFTTERTTDDTSYIPPCYFVPGYGISSEFSSFEILYDEALGEPRILERNLERAEITKKKTPGHIYYEATGLTAIKWEELSPGITQVLPNLEVAMNTFQYQGIRGEFTSWEELGTWMYNDLLKGRQEISQKTRAEITALTAGVEDIYEKSKIVYQYVQEQTRYISVQVGIGGMQPIAAIEVDRVKYGDCKGLTNYTIALLKAVGVEAYYVHVESGAGMYDFPEDFASIGAGDHVILAIPYKDGYIWSDCTSKILPFGFLGDFTDNRSVLVITPEGGRLERTEAYLDEDNALTTLATCRLQADGSMEADLQLTARGIQYDNYFSKWERTKDEEEIREWYTRFWSYLNGFQVASFSHEDNRDEVVLREDLKVQVKNYMSAAGDQLILNLNAFNRNVDLPDRYRNRKLPFTIRRGFFDEDEYTFQLPEGYKPESLPLPVHVETGFGTYSASCNLAEDGTLVYKRSFLLKHGLYPRERYKDFRAFLKEVRSADQTKILLVPDNDQAEN